MENPGMQTAATVNQISNEKPRIERTFSTLEGNLGGSFNGGHHRTIAWFRLLPGTRVKEYKHVLKLKLLTPLSPAYQRLWCTADSFFVPDSRVYKDSEKFVAQNDPNNKIFKKPTLAGKLIPFVYGEVQDEQYLLTETSAWRDSFISSYIPRVGYLESYDAQSLPWKTGAKMPDYDACLLRGKRAIWNDFRRNKEYEAPMQEYNGQNVSDAEWESYLPISPQGFKENSMRARRNNSYYTDYRTNMQGLEEDLETLLNNESADRMLLSWQDAEAMTAEARSEAENAQKNTWDILHEIYGTKRKLSEGKIQHLGRYSFPLNYASVTQSAYNEGTTRPEYKAMGQQGAYSYTEIEIPCFAAYEALEGGWVHVELTVTAETVFERGLERTAMNVNWDDEYRPDLKDQKLDILKLLEVESTIDQNGLIGGNTNAETIGFKRKYSEYFKLPNVIFGDMTTANIMQTVFDEPGHDQEPWLTNEDIITQNSHQFFEENAIGLRDANNGDLLNKNLYQDYTDILINKNQAYQNEMSYIDTDSPAGYSDVLINGQNQIFYAGKQILIADLPMDEAIKNNYTKWGEH